MSAASSSTSSSGSAVSTSKVLDYLASTKPSFRDASDAVMYALHAHLVTNRGFRLASVKEEAPAGGAGADAGNKSGSTSSSSSTKSEEGLNRSDDAYSFVYTHPHAPAAGESAPTQYLVKALRMHPSLLIRASTKPSSSSPGLLSLDLQVDDYVNSGNKDLKWNSSASSKDEYSKYYKDLEGLLTQFDAVIASKITPAPPASSSTSDKLPSHSPHPHPDHPSLHDPVHRDPGPGGFQPPVGMPAGVPYPFGRRPGDFEGDIDPLQSFPGAGGNLMGPRNFPFGGGDDGGLGGMGGRGQGGMGMAPRYDPVGPGGHEPDFDELVPPHQPGMGEMRGAFGGRGRGGFGRGRGDLGGPGPGFGGPGLGGPGMGGGGFGGLGGMGGGFGRGDF